ncbi:MAG: aquaporin [Chthoniobacter sp.]|uniref:MIP/aquaporin family protein n=1 Tax=Chthoniobacter sp. TaxID=2510640 RepID=UPI0032A592D2
MSGRTPESSGQLRLLSLSESLQQHWPEYLMEAAALGIFMISAGAFTALFEYPASFVHQALPNGDVRRAFIGVAMGTTATGLIYSPWGRRSGAHMNPAVTIAFLRLGKIPPCDAFFYIAFQFLGGLAGVLLTALALGQAFTQPPVSYVATVPGPAGHAAAFTGELLIAFVMMGMIVGVSNHAAIARFTGLFAGLLIMGYVTFEAPFSGFGMNPARTFASALPSGIWTALWIYFIAPPLGMLLAAQACLLVKSHDSIHCCKLHHRSDRHCIFCGHGTLHAGVETVAD